MIKRDFNAEKAMATIQSIVEKIREVRNDFKISFNIPMHIYLLVVPKDFYDSSKRIMLRKNKHLIEKLCNVSIGVFAWAPGLTPTNSIKRIIDYVIICFPIYDKIDLEKEKHKSAERAAKYEKDVNKLKDRERHFNDKTPTSLKQETVDQLFNFGSAMAASHNFSLSLSHRIENKYDYSIPDFYYDSLEHCLTWINNKPKEEQEDLLDVFFILRESFNLKQVKIINQDILFEQVGTEFELLLNKI